MTIEEFVSLAAERLRISMRYADKLAGRVIPADAWIMIDGYWSIPADEVETWIDEIDAARS